MTERTRRFAIRKVGVIAVNDAGGLHYEGWEVVLPEDMQGSLDVIPFDGGLGGWSAHELHRIAHGDPCVIEEYEGLCGVERVLAEHPNDT